MRRWRFFTSSVAAILAGSFIGLTNVAQAAYGGSTTVGLYDPTYAVFYLRNSNTSGVANITVQYGNSNWKPIAGDWDNNGTFTPGVYDPNTARFYLRNSNTPGPADNAFQYGNIGWTPIAGDWNGNGYWSVGLYDPKYSTFYLKDFNGSGAADYVAGFGNSNWQPFIGDWNNDRITTLGIRNPERSGCMECNTYHYLRNSNTTGPADLAFDFCAEDSQGWGPALAGDWNGNGYWSVGCYRRDNSTFYLTNTNSFNPGPFDADYIAQYGDIGWLPVVGDWDGR